MSHLNNSRQPSPAGGQTIAFAERYFRSEHFDTVFQNGMALVEEAASYLDGEGRHVSSRLDPVHAYAYSTESMRLTARLMQVASWLLIQRAVNREEMSEQQGRTERAKLQLREPSHLARSEDFDGLPETMKDLVARSLKLYERVLCLDHMLSGTQLHNSRMMDSWEQDHQLMTHPDRLDAARQRAPHPAGTHKSGPATKKATKKAAETTGVIEMQDVFKS